VKHLLWHGNVVEAQERQAALLLDLDLIRAHSPAAEKLAVGMSDFDTYIRNNRTFIPNFGLSPRGDDQHGVRGVDDQPGREPAFVKKQQMNWTLRGAHLLLQTRTTVLNPSWTMCFGGGIRSSEPKRRDPRLCAALLYPQIGTS
jgi:hypothetical protein